MKKSTIIISTVAIVATIILGTVLLHPWINQQAVDEYMEWYVEENYPEFVDRIKATLTTWHPFGYHFKIEFYSDLTEEWLDIGTGFVDIVGKISNLEFELP